MRGDGTEVPLTPRVFETLRYLVDHRGRVAEKHSLMDAVWPDCTVEENNLAQNISTLRRAFGDSPGSQRYIATVPGRGYRFIPEVRPSENGVLPAPAKNGIPLAQARTLREPEEKGSLATSGDTKLRLRPLVWATLLLLFLGAAVFLVWRSRAQYQIMTPNGKTPTAGAVSEKSIAVLPFENLSADPGNAYFAEGMKDEILTRLSKIAALKVISRTSTQKFKSTPNNVREIAQELGVAHILEGSVQRSDEKVRVTVQLIHAQTDTHLWAETYDRKLEDIFQVETEVAQRIAGALEATLTGAERRALAAQPTGNREAYHEYLQGRFFWNKRTPEGFKEAVGHFKRAVQLDPGYAQAHVGLADAVIFQGGNSLAGWNAALKDGRAILEQALTLDETLGDAHASLGLLAMNFDWDWTGAEKEFKRAIELNPNYATGHQWYGEFLAYMGRFDEAIAEITHARELDPLSLIINTDVAKVYCMARRYDESIAQFQATLRLDQDFAEAHALMGLVLSKQGRHDEAVAHLRKIRNIEGNAPYLSWLGYAYGRAGRTEEARQIIDRLDELSGQTYVSPLWMAIIWTGFGDNSEAFRALERILIEHTYCGAVSLKVNPIFDDLRSDPRFSEFLRLANFSP